ncbi:MAG: 4Fe-4S dicluster domain-containing protein [Candidatus Thorarchaeota archaeon]
MKNSKITVYPEKCTSCRMCQLICSFTYHQEFNIGKSNIMIINEYDLTPVIQFLNTCSKCALCVKNCLYGALNLEGGDII